MTIQDFLDQQEIDRLMAAVRESSLFDALDSRSRKNWLIAAGIDIDVDTNGNDSVFFGNLYGSLVARDLSFGSAKRLGIVILLDHIVGFDVEVSHRLTPENAEFLRGVVEKYEQSRSNPTPNQRRRMAINPYGASVHTMCDRSRQVAQFIKFFRRNLLIRAGLPQVYLVHGEGGQSHHSFVQRLKIDKIGPYAVWKNGGLTGAVRHIIIPGVQPLDDLEEAKTDLLFSVFEAFGPAYQADLMSAQQLYDHQNLTSVPFVVIEHDFQVARRNAQLSTLVEWYLNTYWATVLEGKHQNQILLFLNFIYPNSVRPLWRRLSPSKPFDKNAFSAFLKNLSVVVDQLYPCLLFDELGHPDQEDVCQTLFALGIHHDETCPEWLESLFKQNRGKVTMVDVERLIRTHLGLPTEQQQLNIS